jgi:tetratricopeptide (TPR) repeat protein
MPRKPRVVAVLLVAALAGMSRVQAADGQWFMASTGNAVVIGHNSTAAVRLIADLAAAQAIMQQVAAIDLRLPVRAFATKDEKQLRELVPQYWERRGVRPHGASYAGPHAAFIAIRTDIPAGRQLPLLLHEYTHLLTAAHVPEAPAWLDEGLSEFWSTLAFDGSQAIVGRPPAQYLKPLRTRTWLPLSQVRQWQRGKLSANQDEVEMFYAQSWALVHYLLLGKDVSVPTRFAPVIPEWTPEFEGAVRAYSTQEKFREVQIPSTKANLVPAAARPVSEARVLAESANMLVFGERPAAALPLVRRALSLTPGEPLALEVMGTYYFLHNQPDQAREWLSQALAAEPASYSAALYLALLPASKADRERYLTAAVRSRPDLAVAWQRLWALYVEDGRAEQGRRWCNHISARLRPWIWMDAPIHCEGKDPR